MPLFSTNERHIVTFVRIRTSPEARKLLILGLPVIGKRIATKRSMRIKAFTGMTLTCPKCKLMGNYASHQEIAKEWREPMCMTCAKTILGCPWKLGYGQVWDSETGSVINDSPEGARR